MPDYVLRPVRRQSRIAPIGLVFITILLAVSIFFVRAGENSNNIVSPIPKNQISKPSSNMLSLFQKKKDPETLRSLVKTTVGNASKNYSVFVKDYFSDFVMAIDENIIYVAASINKVPILAALYNKVQTGDVDLNRVITMQAGDIQDYGTGSMRYDPPGTLYSVKTMARLMMKQSDNTAAYMIANHILNLRNIQTIVTDWGLAQTDMIKNNTSNKDMAALFEKIFKGDIAGEAYTEEMKSLLTDSDFENRLPALLPGDVTVYHKIGTEVGVVHDIGVVETPKKTYYIGVMIGDATDEEKTEELIAQISKKVYDFMQ